MTPLKNKFLEGHNNCGSINLTMTHNDRYRCHCWTTSFYFTSRRQLLNILTDFRQEMMHCCCKGLLGAPTDCKIEKQPLSAFCVYCTCKSIVIFEPRHFLGFSKRGCVNKLIKVYCCE